jgi:hypothetical protein
LSITIFKIGDPLCTVLMTHLEDRSYTLKLLSKEDEKALIEFEGLNKTEVIS